MARKGSKLTVQPQVEYRAPVFPPTVAAPGVLCAPHLERTGQRMQAYKVVYGTPMCERCWKNLNPPVLPTFNLTQKPAGARSQNAKVFHPMHNTTQQGRPQSASP